MRGLLFLSSSLSIYLSIYISVYNLSVSSPSFTFIPLSLSPSLSLSLSILESISTSFSSCLFHSLTLSLPYSFSLYITLLFFLFSSMSSFRAFVSVEYVRSHTVSENHFSANDRYKWGECFTFFIFKHFESTHMIMA